MSTVTLNTATLGHPRRSVSIIMLHVLVALVPGVLLYSLLIDSRLPGNLLMASCAALLCEALLLAMRKRPVLTCLKDASIILAACLLVLSVPQGLPTWQLLFGVMIMCTLGKHVFGGLGHNPFNPAMVAYAVLIVSFPLTMTQWSTELGLLDAAIEKQDTAASSPIASWDSVSQATPLDHLDTLKRGNRQPESSYSDTSRVDTRQERATPAALVLGSDWVWVSIAWLIGGVYLLTMRVITWHIPVTILATLASLYAIYGLASANPVLPASVALLSGAIMLGAFFIATDPVSSATSKPGKLVYGAGIGALCFFIREFSAYPEGFAFAVLLMNLCVPLIDHAFIHDQVVRNKPGHADEPPS